MSDDKALTAAPPKAKEPTVPVLMGERGVDLSSLEAAWRFAQGVISGGMAPKGMREPGAVVAIIEAGMELGLPPMFALSNLTFINGKLGIMGDAARALIRQKKKLRDGTGIDVSYEGEPYEDDFKAVVTSWRKEEAEPVSHDFSVADAKKANLWGKSGPWSEYPKRMLMYRALGFHVRDQYPDVMMGAAIAEEIEDYPANPKGRPEREVNPPEGKDPLLVVAEKASGTATAPAAEEPEDAEVVPPEPEPEPEDDPEGKKGPEADPGPGAEEGEPGFALEPPPDCTHPEGFAGTEERPEAHCVHCGEPEAGPEAA